MEGDSIEIRGRPVCVGHAERKPTCFCVEDLTETKLGVNGM